MYSPHRKPINAPIAYWEEAVNFPGANQMIHLRKLMESKPYLTRIPAQELVVEPSAGGKRIVATKDQAGTYAMIYIPTSRSFEARTGILPARQLQVTLFDPRSGESKDQGRIDNMPDHVHRFTLPNNGENQDWVIILDERTSK